MQITEIKGIGEKTAALLKKIEIETVNDALLYYPRTYIQFPQIKSISEVVEGEVAAVVGRVISAPIVKKVRAMQLTVTTIGDTNAKLNLVWFRMPYIKNALAVGESYVFYGKVQHKNGRFCMEQPVMYGLEQYQQMEECFLPVYTVINKVIIS